MAVARAGCCGAVVRERRARVRVCARAQRGHRDCSAHGARHEDGGAQARSGCERDLAAAGDRGAYHTEHRVADLSAARDVMTRRAAYATVSATACLLISFALYRGLPMESLQLDLFSRDLSLRTPRWLAALGVLPLIPLASAMSGRGEPLASRVV